MPPPHWSSVIPGHSAEIWYDPVPPALTMSHRKPSRRSLSAHSASTAIASRICRRFSSAFSIRSKCPSYPMMPTNLTPLSLEMANARSSVSRPGRVPTRSRPMFISMMTRHAAPFRTQIAARGSTWAKWSQATIGSAQVQSAASRSHFGWPTIMFAIKISRIPAAAMTSASETLATVTPMAPAAISFKAMAGVL